MAKSSRGRKPTKDLSPEQARQARITARRTARRRRVEKTSRKRRPWLLPLLVFVGLALAGVLALVAASAAK